MEDPWQLGEAMLTDVLVSNVYDQFMLQNQSFFKDKVVLDVGCRSGLLSMLAVEAGAIKVFAVGNMQSAKCVTKALAHGEKAEVFEPLTGCISQITLPCGLRKVDIIVSEWMGHALFADSLLPQLLYARDKWLAKNGHMFPSVANLYIQGITQSRNEAIDLQLMDDYVDRQSLVTEKFLLKSIDLASVKDEAEFLKVEFEMKALRNGKVSACLLYFDIYSTNTKGQLQKLFSIGPESPRTYMTQTVLFLEEDALEVMDQQLLCGRFSMALDCFAPRGVVFSLGIWLAK